MTHFRVDMNVYGVFHHVHESNRETLSISHKFPSCLVQLVHLHLRRLFWLSVEHAAANGVEPVFHRAQKALSMMQTTVTRVSVPAIITQGRQGRFFVATLH